MNATLAPPALYLRCADLGEIETALRVGADGVSLDVSLGATGVVTAGRETLDVMVAQAQDAGLAVEVVVGSALDSESAAPLLAAVVATMVSAKRVREAVRLSAFDHVALTSIGRSVGTLTLGLRHLVSLHRGEDYAANLGVTALHPLASELLRGDVERAAARGITTHAWTLALPSWPVEESTQFRRALDAGADAITLSDPSLISSQKDAR